METLILTYCLMQPPIAELVNDLGHEDFYRREAATQALAALGPLSFPFLDAALDCPDAEIAVRARRLLLDAWLRCSDPLVMPTSYPRLPCLDALPEDYPERPLVIDAYLRLARLRIIATGNPEWPDYREATRLWVRDQVIGGHRSASLRQLLDRMADKEQTWLRRCNR